MARTLFFFSLVMMLPGCGSPATPKLTVAPAGAISGLARGGKTLAAGAPPASPASPAPSTSLGPAAFGLAVPAARAPGPIVVRGYPHGISNGMNDPAHAVGFSADGAEYGYCAEIAARDPPFSFCETLTREGTTVRRSSDERESFDAAKKRALDAWIRDAKLTTIPEGIDVTPVAPKLTGTWAYPDIELAVMRVAASQKDSGDVVHPAFLRVGGAVAGEPPVYPVSLITGELHNGAHFVAMNDLSLSPDGSEIGMVGHFFACEWCDAFVVKRMKVGALASLVYNDTGMRHHEKLEWTEAAALFLAAGTADPGAALPPYNLACALARLGDEAGAEKALRWAIATGKDVKRRATKDADFAAVKDHPWFLALVR